MLSWMSQAIEACANCGTLIGKLEMPCEWKGSVVCAACHARLLATPVATSKELSSAVSEWRDYKLQKATARPIGLRLLSMLLVGVVVLMAAVMYAAPGSDNILKPLEGVAYVLLAIIVIAFAVRLGTRR